MTHPTVQNPFSTPAAPQHNGIAESKAHRETAVWIIWEGQKCSNFYAYDTFEPIPHHDTSLLDWLLEKDPQLRSRWYTDEHDNLRDAIDAAMKETN